MAATQTFTYQAFGLSFRSELEIPEFLPLPDSWPIDIQINLGSIAPEYFEDITFQAFWKPTSDYFVFDVPETARYLVENGRHITIEPATQADPNNIRLFLLGTCLGAIFHQRELLPIHGSAITTPKGCVIFSGEIGVGKSTLATAFYKKGYDIIADDIALVRFYSDRMIAVEPSFPQIKLSTDIAEILGIETAELAYVGQNTMKYKLPIHKQFHRIPEPLTKIFFIERHQGDHFQIDPLIGFRKFTLLSQNTYRKSLIEGLGKTRSHFHQSNLLTCCISMNMVRRPANGLRLLELADFLEEQL